MTWSEGNRQKQGHSAEEAKDQGENDREHNRCYNWEIDADISTAALVLDVAGQKRKAGRNIRPIGSCTSVSQPTDDGKGEQHDNKDFEKGIHGLRRISAPSSLQAKIPCSLGWRQIGTIGPI